MTRSQVMKPHHLPGPLVVSAVGNHEFDLVVRAEALQVSPEVVSRHSAFRALDVVNQHGPLVDRRDVYASPGLNQDLFAGVEELFDENMNTGLKERLAARDLDQAGRIPVDLLEDLADGHILAFREGVGGIAVPAAQIAAREPDKGAGAPGMGRFPLQTVEDFVDRQLYRFHRIFP